MLCNKIQKNSTNLNPTKPKQLLNNATCETETFSMAVDTGASAHYMNQNMSPRSKNATPTDVGSATKHPNLKISKNHHPTRTTSTTG